MARPRTTTPGFERKTTRTCSITPSTEATALEHFGTLGRAVELAAKYHEKILQLEAKAEKKVAATTEPTRGQRGGNG